MPRPTMPDRSLAALRPDLVAELDRTRHLEFDASAVAAGSHRKLWWRCAFGHAWEASVKNRVNRGSGWPHCANHRKWRVARELSLAARFPHLVAELDPTRNGALDPWTLPPATAREVWWRGCPEGHPAWRTRPGTGSRARAARTAPASSRYGTERTQDRRAGNRAGRATRVLCALSYGCIVRGRQLRCGGVRCKGLAAGPA
jgi:hypothetical protein